MKQQKIIPKNLYNDIKVILETARERSYRIVNFLMAEAYWNIGRLIVEEEQKGKRRADYGTYLIKELAERLTKDFGKGFDERNLWYMIKFYGAFPIVNALRSDLAIQDAARPTSIGLQNYFRPELSWTHYRLLLKLEKEQFDMERKLMRGKNE